MPKYFLDLRYDGTAYHGWQIQLNSNTVQAEVNAAILKIHGEKVSTIGAGRTDTGVHAEQLFCHFDCLKEITDFKHFTFRINSVLPNDIAVKSIIAVNDNAHARFDATKRKYKYVISKIKNPFLVNKALYYPYDLDISMMNMACAKLKTHQHFSSFSKSGVQVKTDICAIEHASWIDHNEVIEFNVTADRFLRNMVRAIVGTMLEIGKGKMNIQMFEDVILSKDRGKAGTSVPAHGLYLTAVEYPENIFK